jgi:hypothetical protein
MWRVTAYIDGRHALLTSPMAAGLVRDCPGDFLADDIFCLADGPRALDCLDFDNRLRWIDVLDDVACRSRPRPPWAASRRPTRSSVSRRPSASWRWDATTLDFSPTTDEEVIVLLDAAAPSAGALPVTGVRGSDEDVSIAAGGVVLGGRLHVPASASALVIGAGAGRLLRARRLLAVGLAPRGDVMADSQRARVAARCPAGLAVLPSLR